jgi:hypothetical protein
LRAERLEDRTVPAWVPLTAIENPAVVGAGGGDGNWVTVLDGAGAEVFSFEAYERAFRGGVSAALGDITGDGVLDVITGAGESGGPHVRAWDGMDGHEVTGFFAYDTAFRGGVNVAAGDINGDGRVDIVTGAGFSGGPHVRVFDAATAAEIRGFFAYNFAFRGGVFVATANFDGDAFAEIVTGAGPSGGPHVRVWAGRTGAEVAGFIAGEVRSIHNLHARDENRDGVSDLLVMQNSDDYLYNLAGHLQRVDPPRERPEVPGTVRPSAEWRGTHGGLTDPRREIVRDAGAWASLWEQLQSTTDPAPVLPGVDFSQNMVIVVTMGEQTSGGYYISIPRIRRTEDALVVTVRERRPQPHELVLAVLTQPYHIVVVPKTDLPVRFVEGL